MGSTKTVLETKAPAKGSDSRKWIKWAVPLALGIMVLIIPRPEGLTPAAWHYFALFIAVIAALITEPFPGPVVGFVGIAFGGALMFVGKTPGDGLRWALSGFSNSTVWLIYAASLFALGYEVTGLGRRIALFLVHKLGRRTLGLGYAVALSDLVLAPFTSSNTARASSVFPIVNNIPPLYGSSPTENPRKIGSYIMWVAFASQCVSSAMFLTALAPNVLAVELARKIAKIDISWTAWFYGFLPVGIFLFLAVPLLTYILYPPELKISEEVPKWAGAQLAELGKITRREMTMAILALIALSCWIGATKWILPEMTALVICALMMLTRVVTWNDIAGNKQGWTNLVWLATLVTMADGLATGGLPLLVCQVERDGSVKGCDGADDDRAGDDLLPGALFLCQPQCPHDSPAAGVSGRDDDSAGASDEAGDDGDWLYAGIDGRHHAVCDGTGADLLRGRIYQDQGLLEAGIHLRHVLPGRIAAG